MATVAINSINVNEQLSPIFREVLYADRAWRPGVTFTERYIKPGALAFYANKLADAGDLVPVAPGGDYSETELGTSQVTILANNVFSKSEKVRRVTVASLFDSPVLLSEKADSVMNQVANGWQLAMSAKVADEATDIVDQTAITESNVKAVTISAIKELVDSANLTATFIMPNSTVYYAMMEFSGREFFPTSNEVAMSTGVVAKWFGLDVVRNNMFSASNILVKYIDDAGALSAGTNLSKVQFVIGRPDDIAGGAILDTAEIQKAIAFNGSLVQSEVAAGFKVLDADRVLIRTII